MSLSKHINPTSQQSSFLDCYQTAFRRHVFILVCMAADRLSKGSWSTEQEETITGELVRIIEVLLQDPKASEWMIHYTVHEEPRIHQAGRSGKRRRRLDLAVQQNGVHGTRPRYSFESKRLSKGKVEVHDFLGAEGLGEFLQGHYAADQAEAGMIGYIQTDTVDEWATKISKRFDTDTKLMVQTPWESISLITNHNIFRSSHYRTKNLPEITIYHLLLDFVTPS